MYYVENHHAAIIPKVIFQRVQEEMSRRASKRKVLQKSAKTEQGKYSGKYALTERLVCGACGSPYKRCTWTIRGRKQIVWRCVSRMEFGKKYCHNSPTLDEGKLHQAILDAINEYADAQRATDVTMECAVNAIGGTGTGGVSLADLQMQLQQITEEQEFRAWLQAHPAGLQEYNDRLVRHHIEKIVAINKTQMQVKFYSDDTTYHQTI